MEELPPHSPTRAVQLDASMDAMFSATRVGRLDDVAPSGGKRQHSVLVFPNYRDRLACDPQNYFCVYGEYEYRWKDSVADTERSLFALVDAMLSAVRRAYDEALEYWQKLPLSTKQAHALRSVATMSAGPLPSTTLHAGLHGDTPTRGAATRKHVLPRLGSFRAVSRVQMSGTGSSGRGAHKRGTMTRSLWREDEEEAIMNNLLQQWYPPNNGPKCRVVLDIIASRKTLGENSTESEPYRLGQKVYRYVKTMYATEVMTTFVGISDRNVTLVGRDILYPYRVTGGGGGTTTFGTGRNFLSSRQFASRFSTGTSVLASTDGFSTTVSGGMAAMLSNMETLLSGTIPVPRIVTAPPTNTDKVDNVRLVVCFPPTDTESNLM